MAVAAINIETAPHRVLIADDDPLVRRVLRSALEKSGFRVIAETATGRDTADMALHCCPDILVLDLVMPGGDGIDVIRRLRTTGSQVPIVVLTASDDEDAALLALRAGAIGIVSKQLALDELPLMLERVLEGEAAISRRLVSVLIDRLRALPDGQIGTRPVRSRLTPREWEVLDLLCADMTTEEMAAELVLSLETVRSHIKSILRKVGARNRAEAVAMAPRMRLPE